jgi:hypothetical protein
MPIPPTPSPSVYTGPLKDLLRLLARKLLDRWADTKRGKHRHVASDSKLPEETAKKHGATRAF